MIKKIEIKCIRLTDIFYQFVKMSLSNYLASIIVFWNRQNKKIEMMQLGPNAYRNAT